MTNRRAPLWKPDIRGLLAPVAGLAAVAAHTSLPAGPFVAAVLAVTRVHHVKDWRQRLAVEITRWAEEHREQWAITADLPSDFEEILLDALDERGQAELDPSDPRARAVFVDALTSSVLKPNFNSPKYWADSKAAAEALVAELPKLLVLSAPDDTPLAPLRYLIGKDIAEVKEELLRLSAVMGPVLTELAVGLYANWTRQEWAAADLRRFLETRLPPAPADWVTVQTYLAAIIHTLDEDPWIRAARGPQVSLSAVQRKLLVHVDASQAEVATSDRRDIAGTGVDADGLVGRCERLVVLGGPGSGKSWLARRSAIRAAEEALVALTGPAELDRVEVPLFARCSQFLSLAATAEPWTALVEAALINEVGAYLGSERVREALRARFAEQRAGRYLVVLDGLDEALTIDSTLIPFKVLTDAPAAFYSPHGPPLGSVTFHWTTAMTATRW